VLRHAAKTTRFGGHAHRVAIVLITALCTALGVMMLGSPGVKGPEVADADAGTTVGSAQYPVPSGALIVSPSGDDAAAGTTAAPFRTLGRALAVAQTGATIVLRAGTYHESVAVYKRVTIQAWPGEGVWLDGSTRVPDWTPAQGRWSAGWTTHLDASPTYTRGAADNTAASWGFVNAAYPMAAHPDQVWINGVAQRQVGSLAAVVPGAFFFDEAANQLWLGTDPSGKEVRASDLVRALMLRADGTIVRGLGVRRYAPSVPDMGAVTVERAGIHLENVAITDSATTGLNIGSSYDTSGVVLRNVQVARSGMLGIGASYADNLTVDQVESIDNNTEHFNTAPVSGGIKIGRSRGVLVRDSVFSQNDGPGVWFDVSSYDMNVTGNEIANNTKHGISLEISAKANVANNTITGNRGFGIKVNNTSDVALSNNTFVGNDRSINAVQDARTPATEPSGRDPRHYPDPNMTWLVGPVSVSNNVLSNQASGTCMLCVEDYTHLRTAEQMGVTANGDTYARPNASTPATVVLWSRGAGNAAAYADLGSFRTATGQEMTGSEAGTTTATTTTTKPAPTTTTTAPAPTTTTTKPAPTTTTTKPAPTTTTTTKPAPTEFVNASDAFGRTIANGLGTADVGGPWTVSRTTSAFSVANGVGRMTGAVAANRSGFLTQVDQADMDIITDISLDRVPSGGGAYVSVIGRRVSNGTEYRLLVRYMPDHSVIAYLKRYVGGTETTLAWKTVPGLTVNAGDTVRARFLVAGNSPTILAAAVWQKGQPGPSTWTVTAGDNTPSALRTSGDVGVELYVSRSWKGTAPIMTIDNYRMVQTIG
jgi:parallel beta-helix repeat protein